MVDSGFDFGELSELTREVLDIARTDYPKETKKFLKKEATKGQKLAKSTAKSEVNKKTGEYLKGLNQGKSTI